MDFIVEERKMAEKARRKEYAQKYYLRVVVERRRRARAEQGEEERDVSPFSCTWRPPCETVPSMAMGKAAKVRCRSGHEFIATSLPQACPEKDCGRKMVWKGDPPKGFIPM